MGRSMQAGWYNDEHTIILQTYHGVMDWGDFAAMMQDMQAMLDSVDHPVDILADFRDLVVPANVMAHFPEIAAAPTYHHRNARRFVIIGMSAVVGALLRVFAGVYGGIASRMHPVETLEDALALLAGGEEAAG